MTTQEIKEFCKHMQVNFESLIDGVLTTYHRTPVKAGMQYKTGGTGEHTNSPIKTIFYKKVTLKWRIKENEQPYLIK